MSDDPRHEPPDIARTPDPTSLLADAEPLHLLVLAGSSLVGVLIADSVVRAFEPSTIWLGALDWTAHLAVLAALIAVGAIFLGRGWLSPAFIAGAAIGAVVLDLDHVPAYLGSELLLADGVGRPVTHSFIAVALAAACAMLLTGAARAFATGLTLGLAAHLWRDTASPVGIPALWPASDVVVSFSYAVLVVPLALLVALAAAKVALVGRSALAPRA